MSFLNLSPKSLRVWRSPEWISLWVLMGFTLVAVLGYWAFALHPHWIPDTDDARAFFGVSFGLFARVHIVLAGLVLAVPLVRRAGGAWIPALLAIYVVSFLSEFIGTGYGFPFGGYAYTGLLGFKLGGRVPALIPLSWFLMALPSWVMAKEVFPLKSQLLGRVVFGAYLLTAWDLALDPAMSYLTPYWIWEDKGPFYGMPWVNLLGWMGTGAVLMLLLDLFGAGGWTENLSLRWLVAFYGVMVLMPLGMVVAAGLWAALLATSVSLALAAGVGLRIRARSGIPSSMGRAPLMGGAGS